MLIPAKRSPTSALLVARKEKKTHGKKIKKSFKVYDTYVLSDPVGWAKGWGSLAADVAADPVMRNRVMFDLMNEPDGRGIGWSTGPGKGNYGATALFLMAMDEIYKVNPTGLFLIEGSGQPGIQMSWGDGFASDPWVVGSGQSAAPFFEAVLQKPYAANVVLSPHVYPSSVFDNHNPAVTTGPPVSYVFFLFFLSSGGRDRGKEKRESFRSFLSFGERKEKKNLPLSRSFPSISFFFFFCRFPTVCGA